MSDIILQSENIKLRKLSETDEADLALLLNNKKIWDNLRDFIPFPYTQKDAHDFISLCLKEKVQSKFGIEYKGKLAGVIALIIQKDVHRKTAEVGYWIGEPFWGLGIISKAVALITGYGFKDLDLVRIEAGVYDYNKASMKVLEKNGFQLEGIFKKNVFKNGSLHDEYKYALINPAL